MSQTNCGCATSTLNLPVVGLELKVDDSAFSSIGGIPQIKVYGRVASDGTLKYGSNVAYVTKLATGTYQITFAKPMKSENYVAIATHYATMSNSNWNASASNALTTSCVFHTNWSAVSDQEFSFMILGE